ncbi:MAG: VanW family protein [Candidatus Kerfeldbacteria bacterium]|nr:VanW family protein [Candidatus Kerfeldbacteria bacterium]
MTTRPKSGKNRPTSRPRVVAFFAVAGVLAALLAVDATVRRAYAGKILPGVRIGDQNVGGTLPAAALEDVRNRMNALDGEGLTLQFGDKKIILGFTLADQSGLGLTTDVLEYDPDGSVKTAASFGRSGSPLIDGINRLRSLVSSVSLAPRYTLDRDDLNQALHSILSGYEQPVREPGFELNKNGAVKVIAPSAGRIFNYDSISVEVEDRLRRLSSQPLSIDLVSASTDVTAAQAEQLLPEVKEVVAAGALTMRAGEEKLTVKPAQFMDWLQPQFQKNGAAELGVSREKLKAYLISILPTVNLPPKDAKFLLENGKVKEVQSSSSGSELDLDAALATIAQALPKKSMDVTLTMRIVAAQATAENIQNLGIVELVAEGRTNFAGSPVNRRHNIKIGDDLLNGLLIKPGAEFSLIKAIGPVDATLGYRQELVIKENRTIPEFGGGLCQIGTTMFRLVLNAGLPIVERKNHSYRVRYYEPPVGMDATIYEPKPDFRFKNDYAGYLLLQTRIEGDDLIFEFWGKKDGRTVDLSKPRVFNVVSPPEQLTIETTDLKPGETKCTEKAHVGSDAEFTYTVRYADGRTEQETFKSHYKPWRAVCFVGVKELKKENGQTKNENTNASTKPTNTNAPANTNAT